MAGRVSTWKTKIVLSALIAPAGNTEKRTAYQNILVCKRQISLRIPPMVEHRCHIQPVTFGWSAFALSSASFAIFLRILKHVSCSTLTEFLLRHYKAMLGLVAGHSPSPLNTGTIKQKARKTRSCYTNAYEIVFHFVARCARNSSFYFYSTRIRARCSFSNFYGDSRNNAFGHKWST